eukprot:SAG31_NODE_547_length_14228_cov_3.787105_8_plen_90_part_00
MADHEAVTSASQHAATALQRESTVAKCVHSYILRRPTYSGLSLAVFLDICILYPLVKKVSLSYVHLLDRGFRAYEYCFCKSMMQNRQQP